MTTPVPEDVHVGVTYSSIKDGHKGVIEVYRGTANDEALIRYNTCRIMCDEQLKATQAGAMNVKQLSPFYLPVSQSPI